MDNPLYKRNQTIVKIFGTGANKKIKVITLNSLRVSGAEIGNGFTRSEDAELYRVRLERLAEDPDNKELAESVYTLALWARPPEVVPLAGDQTDDQEREKMREAKSRARAKIFDYAFCNEWQWFFTGTLDQSKYNREDLNTWHKDLTQWLRDYAKNRKMPKIDFLLIPELHADGKSWHMHGLINGLPAEQLQQFRIGDQMSSRLAQKVKRGEVLYNWIPYMKKFGFCDLEPVKDAEAVSLYCTKYITKSLQHSVKEAGAHLYYHSRGLNSSELVAVGDYGGSALPDPVYSNEYCSVVWLPYNEENIMKLRRALGKVVADFD